MGASKNDIANKDEDEDKAEKNTTNEEENDKNKEKDKDKIDDDEKTKKGNKDDKVEKKRKKIFKTYICNICKNEIMKKTQASISCKACMEWCHIKKCSGLKNTREAQIMNSTYRCQICVKNGRELPKDPWEALKPPKRGRPRGSTTSKLLHFPNHQRSESKKRKSFDKEVTPVKRSPQGKKNNNADDRKENKISKDKPTEQTKENNKKEEKMETEP